jgi:hypothetical protein
MTADRRYRASERALLTELGDGTGVLLDLDSKFYFTLNATAISVWKHLGGPVSMSREELVTKLTSEFEVSADQAGSDLDAVLELLARERLVTISAAGA